MLFYQPPSGAVGKKKKNELSGWSDREDWKLSGPMRTDAGRTGGSKARSSRGKRRLRGPRVEVLSTTEAVRPLIHGPLLLKAHPLNNLYRTIALTCSLVLQGVCLPPTPHPLFILCVPLHSGSDRLFSERTKQSKVQCGPLGLRQSQGSDRWRKSAREGSRLMDPFCLTSA